MIRVLGRARLAAAVAVVALIASASVSAVAQNAQTKPKVMMLGAGATFPAPLYEKWIQAYRERQPGTAIKYDSVGSGEGQRRFLTEAVDFGASDAALTDEQIARAKS